MATRTAPQTADEGDADRETGRASAPFQLGNRDVQLYEPTDSQRFILLQTVSVSDEAIPDDERLELVLGFGQMLRALFVEATDRQYATTLLARGDIEIEDYFQLAKDMVEHWAIEAAPPVNRQERRARERRPAKAVARPRR
jgi:hypothetical protein